MALIIDETSLEETAYLNFIFHSDGSFFEGFNARQESIYIRYLPKIDLDFEKKSFRVFFFNNDFLNAENDVFEVYEKNLEKRIGWLFPIANLEPSDNSLVNQYLLKYIFPTFKLMLEMKNISIPNRKSLNEYSILDFYPEDLIIFVVSMETLNHQTFDIKEYIPSFAKFGYFEFNNDKRTSSLEKINDILKRYRGAKRLQIQKAKISLADNVFLDNFYKKYLKFSDNFLLKFFILYQVIEYLIEQSFNNDFELFLSEFKENKFQKNDLKEKIDSLYKERLRIKRIISRSDLDEDLISNFRQNTKQLLGEFKENESTDISDLLYDVRNLVIHNYHKIINKNKIQ